MAVLYTPHFVQFFDNDGNPLSGGKLYTYEAGTTTPKPTFTTNAGSVENDNPVILDSAGIATVFITGAYKFALYDSNDVLIKTTDNVTAFTTTGESESAFFESFSGNASTTAFTLSEDLGTDEKLIMVFVDAGGGKGFDIQPTSAYTINGTTLTFGSAPASGSNNIQVWAPAKLAGAAAASADAASDSASSAATSASNASDSETVVQAIEDRLTGIASTSSIAIGTGSKAFTVASGLGFTAGQFVLIDSDADGSNYMYGQVTDYTSTTLTVNVIVTGGSGTYDDWTITISGARGATGAAGVLTATSGVQAESTSGLALKNAAGETMLLGGAGNSKNFTLYGNWSGASTHKLVNMPDPTSAQDYATKNYVDNNGGGLVLLGSYTASSATSVDIGSGLDLDAVIDGTYDEYILKYHDIVVATDGADINLNVSEDGGSTFKTGASDYSYAFYQIASNSVIGQLSDDTSSHIKIVDTLGNATGESGIGEVSIINPSGTSLPKYFRANFAVRNTNGFLASFGGNGLYQATTNAINALRVFASSGNIASGTFYLYGVRKS